MQLICPSCASEYQVSADAIGPKGRMVRCAACNSEWFQTPGERGKTEAKPAPVAATEPAPVPTPEPVEVEAKVAAPEPVETAPEKSSRRLSALGGLGEDDGYKATYSASATQADDDFSDLRADAAPVGEIYYDVDPEPQASAEIPVVEETAMRSRRSAELDDLTASLRSADDAVNPRSGGSFLAGFATVTLLALVLIAVYVKAPDIARLAPAVEGPLSAYASIVDQGRVSIAQLVTGG